MTMQNALSSLHSDSIDLTALAELLAHELTQGRSVHPNDAGKADLGAVADLLAQRLAVLRDNIERETYGTARGAREESCV